MSCCSASNVFPYQTSLQRKLGLPIDSRNFNRGMFSFIVSFNHLVTFSKAKNAAVKNNVLFLLKPINTLEELAFENDDIPVGCFTNYLQKYVNTSTNPYIQKIAETFKAYYEYEKAFKDAFNGRLVMGESREFAEYNIRTRFTDKYKYFNLCFYIVMPNPLLIIVQHISQLVLLFIL